MPHPYLGRIFVRRGTDDSEDLRRPDPKGENRNLGLSENNFTATISKMVHRSISRHGELKTSTQEALQKCKFWHSCHPGVFHAGSNILHFRLFFEYSQL